MTELERQKAEIEQLKQQSKGNVINQVMIVSVNL